jgi:hypothetical protein
MMSICGISLNGFLSAPELPALSLRCRYGVVLVVAPVMLSASAAGNWYLRLPEGLQPVLLLRDKSFWWHRLALLTVQPLHGEQLRLLVRHRVTKAEHWRRLKVNYLHSRGMLLQRDVQVLLNK